MPLSLATEQRAEPHAAQAHSRQDDYAAFSVGIKQIDRVRDYILGQKEHHAAGYLVADWEQLSWKPSPIADNT